MRQTTQFQKKSAERTTLVKLFRKIFPSKNYVQNAYLLDEALQRLKKVFLVPKVPNIWLKWQNFELFRLKKSRWPNIFWAVFVLVLRLDLRKNCTYTSPRLKDINI